MTGSYNYALVGLAVTVLVLILALVKSVAGRRRAEQAFRQASQAAEAATRAKREFLSNMSHEVRTPMNAILGMTRLALSTNLTPEQREYLELVQASAASLMQLWDDILDYSKIESHTLDLESVAFDLAPMLDEMVGSLAPRAHAKGLELTCHASPGVPARVIGDPRRLRQVLVNLLSNAIKFTESGKVELDVKVESHGERSTRLHFVVTDTGVGVPVDQQSAIFDAFSQADASTTRRYGGTGLGLAISRQLTTLLGGRLWVESEPGHGSRFHVVVELRPTLDPPATGGTPELVERRGQPPLRILLAEDNAVNTRLIRAILDQRGYVTHAVANGREAVAAAAAMTFDLALMDVQMPETDGFEATRAIRRAQAGAVRLPIVALTANVMAGDREACLAAGMDGYLTKPVQAPELFALIDAIAGHASATVPAAADAGPAPPRAPVSFDAEAFLARIDGDRLLLAELVELLKQQIPVALTEIRRCIESGDGPGLQRVAHKLRGSVLQFGAGDAAAAALALETRAREGAVPDAGFPLHALEQELARLMSEIARFEEVGAP